jgi:hypothetical protein
LHAADNHAGRNAEDESVLVGQRDVQFVAVFELEFAGRPTRGSNPAHVPSVVGAP